jgi:hypothetical protein
MCIGSFIQMAASPFVAAEKYKEALAHNLAVQYQEDMLERNAQLADADVERIQTTGHEDVSNTLQKTRGFLGSQKSAAAAAGVSVWGGSVAEIQATTIERGLTLADKIARKAKRDAIQMGMQAMQYRMQAQIVKTTKVSPGWVIAETMIGGAVAGGQGVSQLLSMGAMGGGGDAGGATVGSAGGGAAGEGMGGAEGNFGLAGGMSL